MSIDSITAAVEPADAVPLQVINNAKCDSKHVESVECQPVLEVSDPVDRESEVKPVTATKDTDQPPVSRKELWSYYLYINGNNGIGPFIYSLILFQSLANSAGYDPTIGPGSVCSASGQCVVSWGGRPKAVSSVVLLANSICFSIMTLLFTSLGSAADYNFFARRLLFITTLIFWGAQFASLSLTSPSRWPVAMVVYIISFVAYGAICVFYAAVFPILARNTSRTNELKESYAAGKISREEFEIEESLEKNRISNISTMHYTIGYTITSCLAIALLRPLARNPALNTYIVAFVTAYAVLCGIWWFVFQLPRPGPPLPPGEHYLLIGWKQIWEVARQYKRLPYTAVYVLAFFLLSDGFNTTWTLVFLLQNQTFSFSFLNITYLSIAQAVTSIMGTLGFWYIQKYWKISTKKMFLVTSVVAVVIPMWGMVGIWTNKIGFHKPWEFWAYNVVFGLFQAPYFAFSQTMMAELTPPGFDNMFFGIFGLSNRASSMIGPNVIQAIINKSGNSWDGFPFLFGQCLVAALAVYFGVNVRKGREQAVQWAKERRQH